MILKTVPVGFLHLYDVYIYCIPSLGAAPLHVTKITNTGQHGAYFMFTPIHEISEKMLFCKSPAILGLPRVQITRSRGSLHIAVTVALFRFEACGTFRFAVGSQWVTESALGDLEGSPPSQRSAITHQANWTNVFLSLLSFVKIFANPVDRKNPRLLRVMRGFSGSILHDVAIAAPPPWTTTELVVFRHITSSHCCRRKARERKVAQVMDALEEAESEQIGFPRPSSFPV